MEGPDSFIYRSIVKTVALAPNEIPLGAVSQNDKGAMPPTLDNALNNAPTRTCSFGAGWIPNQETHITPLRSSLVLVVPRNDRMTEIKMGL